MNTPRTDEKTFTGGTLGKCEFVDASFCRQLETELAEMKDAIEIVEQQLDYGRADAALKSVRAILERK